MAQGSHTTFGRYDPQVCIVCGQPIRITKDSAQFHHDDTTGLHAATHTWCGSPLPYTLIEGDTMHRTTTEPEPKPEPEPESEPEPEGDGDDGDDQ